MKIITENIETTFYVTDDGKMSFMSKEQCLRYEQEQSDYKVLRGLHSMKLKVPFLFPEGLLEETWYLVRNKQERDAIFRRWCARYQYNYVNEKSDSKVSDIKVGDWVVRCYEFEDGERDHRGIFTLAYILGKFEGFIETVNKSTVSGMY